ncbi:hypothetical protein EDB89DRAFT_835316 [Lactarius sanguifluus]|nr:hypothetical protein EDB89DRAFT_835316 [Lactarius sanguifluus]
MFLECFFLKQAVMVVELEKLECDHQRHQSEIHAELVTTIGDYLSAHVKSLNAIRWGFPPAKARHGIAEICRSTDPNVPTSDYIQFAFHDNVSPRRHQSQTFGRVHQEPAGSLLSRQKNVYLQTRYLHKESSTLETSKRTRHSSPTSAFLPCLSPRGRPLRHNLTTTVTLHQCSSRCVPLLPVSAPASPQLV